jgi:hypothetical protein
MGRGQGTNGPVGLILGVADAAAGGERRFRQHDEIVAVSVNDARDDITQVHQQVKAICDLGRVGRPGARTVGVGGGPIATNDLHARVAGEPCAQAVGVSFREQIDHAPALEIAQNRAVGPSFTVSPVVDS